MNEWPKLNENRKWIYFCFSLLLPLSLLLFLLCIIKLNKFVSLVCLWRKEIRRSWLLALMAFLCTHKMPVAILRKLSSGLRAKLLFCFSIWIHSRCLWHNNGVRIEKSTLWQKMVECIRCVVCFVNQQVNSNMASHPNIVCLCTHGIFPLNFHFIVTISHEFLFYSECFMWEFNAPRYSFVIIKFNSYQASHSSE